MGKSRNEKEKLILTWFRKYTQKDSETRKLSVLNTWIKICCKHEEFQIAEALQREINKIKNKQNKKSLFSILKTKIRNLFKKN